LRGLCRLCVAGRAWRDGTGDLCSRNAAEQDTRDRRGGLAASVTDLAAENAARDGPEDATDGVGGVDRLSRCGASRKGD